MKTIAQTALGVVIGAAMVSALGAAAGPSEEIVTKRLVLVNAEGTTVGEFRADHDPRLWLRRGEYEVELYATADAAFAGVRKKNTICSLDVHDAAAGVTVRNTKNRRAFLGTDSQDFANAFVKQFKPGIKPGNNWRAVDPE